MDSEVVAVATVVAFAAGAGALRRLLSPLRPGGVRRRRAAPDDAGGGGTGFQAWVLPAATREPVRIHAGRAVDLRLAAADVPADEPVLAGACC